MYYNESTQLFLDDKFVLASSAKTDLYSQTLHYGYGVFEGIRSYKTPNGTKIFKSKEHYERLQQSAKYLQIPFEYSVEELEKITYELLELNGFKDAYIRPMVYADANMSLVAPTKENTHLMIAAWEWGAYLGDKQLSVELSPYQRPNPKSLHVEAKANGHYVNSILACIHAKNNGFDEALLLDADGFVAEAPGANFFLEKNGELFTPQLGTILPGITRATVIEIAQEKNIKVTETKISLDDLWNADSCFFCGTAAEVIGIKNVQDNTFPLVWENSLGKQIQETYSELVRKG